MLTSENRLFDLSITLGIVGASCSNNMIKNQTLFIHLGCVLLPICSIYLFVLECFSQVKSNMAFSISRLPSS